ncbi:MAG: serine/threonine protein phosphatase [Symploca sp. SIO1C2]|nr:serine/threonine protein phosphatase [Symploca sp. SIO1C2]
MDNPTAMLHCPNTRCQVPNPQSNKFCEQCRTPLLKRYLLAIGKGIKAYKPGEVIAERYLLMDSSVILDMKPGTPPDTPQDIPQVLTPYLRLCPYGLHVPQLYGRLTPTKGRRHSEVWLLEKVPIKVTQMADAQGQLLPELTNDWKDASPMRQLNWLWQIGSLWQPLSTEGVASSLLKPAILRVENSLVRLLELQPDTQGKPTLQQLGQLWSERLAVGISPVIADFFQQLCTQLLDGQLKTSEQLVERIEQALKNCGRNQSYNYNIFASTDAGPSRPQNEDACYPSSEQLLSSRNGAKPLAIVCDGIGGHEGGEVASHLAIDTLQEQLEQLPTDPEQINQTTLTLELELAVCTANDLISQQNDTERRSDRQRMGTTLVMAQGFGHQMYITHVGDSRVYWITRKNCHQVTLDDDLASREVRLGYALYRYAVQQPTSGSLVQALGMNASNSLHPTVQRLILDEDCVFLLCSDGLSDYDRVEQYWETEILPILDGQVDVQSAGKRLVEIANTQNGHDNVTVALVHCQVKPLENGQTQLSVSQPATIPTSLARTVLPTRVGTSPSRVKTQQSSSTPPPKRGSWGLLLGILLLLLLGGGAAAAYLFRGQIVTLLNQEEISTSPPPPIPSESPSVIPSPSPTPSSSVPRLIQPNDWIEIKDDIPLVVRNEALSEEKLIPAGSILQVTEKLPVDKDVWLQVKVCSVAGNNSDTQPSSPASDLSETAQQPPSEAKQTPQPQATVAPKPKVVPGDISRLLETRVKQDIRDNAMRLIPANSKLSSAQLGECEAPATPPSPSPIQTPSPSPTSNPKSPSN